jgi:hypothetical protein
MGLKALIERKTDLALGDVDHAKSHANQVVDIGDSVLIAP